ncbi:PD-(D/E)XK nuclease family protein [Paracoccus contaminans]|uniref:PD-(D/E)XK nuclease family protein n=1 Tax=Paracoccus contaminans TaxID=1945662 RepID=UPI0030845149
MARRRRRGRPGRVRGGGAARMAAPGCPARPPPPRPVAATALGGDKVLPGDPSAGAQDRAAALRGGTRLHLLLEHLPGTAREGWPARAAALLAGTEDGVPTRAELAALLDDLAAIVEAEALGDVFAPPPGAQVLREVPLTAPLPGGGRLTGVIDRLIVTDQGVTAIDYKSNAVVPADAGGTPSGYLRQMAAYRHALRAIWPGRRIDTAILWTAARELMALPDALLDEAWDAALRDLDPERGRS